MRIEDLSTICRRSFLHYCPYSTAQSVNSLFYAVVFSLWLNYQQTVCVPPPLFSQLLPYYTPLQCCKSNIYPFNKSKMPDQNDELSATDLVANAVSERLQLSGERDRLKTLLMEDLRSHGWTETMYKFATKAAVTHQVEAEHDTMGTAGDGRRPLSAQQLAQLIAKQGHGQFFFFFFPSVPF